MSNPWNPMPSAPTANFFAKPASATAVATPSFLSYPYGSGGATSASASNANLVGGFNNFGNPRVSASGTSNGTATGTNYYNSRPMNNGLAPPSTIRPPPVNNDITSFAIGTFNANNVNGDDSTPVHSSFHRDTPPAVSHFGSSTSPNNLSSRETGIIEKLLHSYGFIQCCERQARLFFHFSQFDGNIEHLKIGDPVEFEVTYDKRNGKPIASVVSKIAPEVVLSEERVTGTVTTELNAAAGQNQGRISYENRGECFFLPYNKDDVEGNVTLRTGDKVSFQIATNQRSGNLAARYIRLEDPAQPVRYQGVICSLKDSFGFIERGDVVREIFFHFSEAKGLPEDLQLGDDVEFSIQTRNGKEVAVQITRLPPGSVIFEDVSSEITKGQVLKPLEKHIPGSPSNANADPLSGRLRYRGKDRSEVEIPFGDKDQKGDYTLRHGDWVQFNVAVDRRDKLQRATNIELLEESFAVSGEKREMGVVCSLKDGFGFIRCADREARLFFHFSELLDPEQEIGLGTEVEFTTVQDQTPPSKQSAIRIRTLSTGTVQFEVITQRNMVGTVTREPANSWTHRSPSKLNGEKHGDELGLVSFIQNNTTEHIPFHPRECDIRNCPRLGDEVEFDLAQIKRNKEFMALNLRVISKASVSSVSNKKSEDSVENEENKKARKVSGDGVVCRGYIAALKESFGFVETEAHDREIFFHYSHFDGNVDDLDLGMEVEYTVTTKGQPQGKLSAENVRILGKNSLPKGKVQDNLLEGVIVRPLRAVNQDATGYPGIVRQGQDVDGDSPTYEFGITSLESKREFLQKGDAVYFKLEEYPDQENKTARATAIRPIRQTLKAQVDAVKGQYGFLNYEVEEGKKLFFHVSEVKDHVSLQPGDTVEFIILSNHRTGKSSAVNVVKVESQAPAPRPERLQVRLRAMSMDDGPRLVVIRQPRGPDGTRGFKKVKEQI